MELHCVHSIRNTELNDLKKILVGEKHKFLLKEFQFIKSLKFGGAWHTLSAMLLYKRRHGYVIIATMTSH